MPHFLSFERSFFVSNRCFCVEQTMDRTSEASRNNERYSTQVDRAKIIEVVISKSFRF